MAVLNFKHCDISGWWPRRAALPGHTDQLCLTPQSISGQLSEFEDRLGVALFRRAGRNRELSDAGRRILSHAEQIFALSNAIVQPMNNQKAKETLPSRVGIADSVSKSVAYRLVEPALTNGDPVRLVCREGRLQALLAELAINRLDMIFADRPMPANLNVRGYSHLLGESGLTVFGAHGLVEQLTDGFPAQLENMPFLLPGEDAATHRETDSMVRGQQPASPHRRGVRQQRIDESLWPGQRRIVCRANGNR